MSKNEMDSVNQTPGKNLNELPSKTFKLKDFELKIFQAENSIIVHVTENKDYSNTLYNAELSLDELVKLNRRIFRAFESIEDVFTEFFKTLGENNITIKKEENKINLTIIYEFLGTQEAKIILNPKKPSLEETVPKLCDKVKEIDSLNLIIDEQKKIIEKQQKEFIAYKKETQEKIKELEALIKKESENLKYNIEYNRGIYLNSDELTKFKAEFDKFQEEIDTKIMRYNGLNLIRTGIKNKLQKKVKKFKLLYRASQHGYTSAFFHNLCDNKNNTVILVETTTGRIFGGFTDATWDTNSGNKSGSNGFIFSLDNNEIYYNINSSYNINCNSSYGPCFGSGYDFYINNNCNTNNSGENMGSSYGNNGRKYPLTGYSSFLVKDYEVFQLELE